MNYSEFLDSINKGNVEMVRVQEDMLSAQYTTKDGSRRDVNLIPNAQIEDQLFNRLADKKASRPVNLRGLFFLAQCAFFMCFCFPCPKSCFLFVFPKERVFQLNKKRATFEPGSFAAQPQSKSGGESTPLMFRRPHRGFPGQPSSSRPRRGSWPPEVDVVMAGGGVPGQPAGLPGALCGAHLLAHRRAAAPLRGLVPRTDVSAAFPRGGEKSRGVEVFFWRSRGGGRHKAGLGWCSGALTCSASLSWFF